MNDKAVVAMEETYKRRVSGMKKPCCFMREPFECEIHGLTIMFMIPVIGYENTESCHCRKCHDVYDKEEPNER